MFYTILQTVALLLTLESAVFLVRGSVGLSAEAIAQLSRSYWDFKPHLVESLSRQGVDTRIGAALLLAGFVVHLLALWRGPTIDELGPANRTGLIVGVLIGALVFAGSWWTASWQSGKVASSVQAVLDERAVSENPEGDEEDTSTSRSTTEWNLKLVDVINED